MKKWISTIFIIILMVALILILFNVFEANNIFSEVLEPAEDINIDDNEDSSSIISKKTGLINNEFFQIDNTGNTKKAIKTRKGLNTAIKYAADNNINNIKLEKGIYVIDTEFIDGYQKGIILQSNINLDLNGSIIKMLTNTETNYGIISIFECKKVSVFNGTLIGEKNEHVFIGKTTHEWGMGVDIRGSQSISIYNLEVYNTTGDAVYMNDIKNILCSDINVYNCNLHDCRRNGISVIAGNRVKIFNNEIHHIGGTIPQCGMDLEKNREHQIIKDIYIYENKFHSQISPNCILIWSNVGDVYIEGNEFEGELKINEKNNENNDLIHVGENKHIGDYPVTFYGEDTDLTDTFKDEKLKLAILERIGKKSTDSIMESDIAKMASDNVAGGKQLNLANKGIKKLDGIEIFAKYNLEWLYINDNEIEDLNPISNIISLTKLNANNNKIEKIEALKQLDKLQTISLMNNNITDKSILNNKMNLRYCYL